MRSDSGPKEVGGTLVGRGRRRADRQRNRRRPAGNRAAGTIAGAAIGGLIGNRIGAAMDDEDKRRAYAAQMQALESGPPARRWHGAIRIPAAMARWCRGRPISRNGMSCRQYTHTIYIDGRPQTTRGTACRNPDGTWQAV